MTLACVCVCVYEMSAGCVCAMCCVSLSLIVRACAQVSVCVWLTADDRLEFEYRATTDKATPINLTNHTYWNLSGNSKSNIREHSLQLHCAHYTPVDAVQIPSGELRFFMC